jgi:hypothetical protein
MTAKVTYIGVSKLRLMAGRSQWCVVCGGLLPRPPDYPRGNHLCAEHAVTHRLRVVDSEPMPDPHRIGETWQAEDRGSDGDRWPST